MATEKVTAQLVIETDKASFNKASGDVKVFARDTKKELDKNTLFQLKLDKANLQSELETARGLLKKAKKEGDKASIIKLQIETNDLRSSLTEAGRQLNNYQNTGDKNLSRLQAKFNQVTDEIKLSREEMMKLGLSSKNIEKVEKATEKLNNEFKKGNISQKKYSEGLRDIRNDAVKTNSSFNLMNGYIKRIGYSLSVYFSARKVVELSESFTSLNNRLKQVAEGDSLDVLREKIFKAANSARADVETYAAAFARFDLVNKQLGGSQDETLIIMDSLAKGLAATGAQASEVNSVMLQLSQAFGSGRLAGDEFRSVSENMPILLDILAEKLGVARGELKEMAAQGLITSDVLKDALIDANEKLNESFEKSSVTIGQSMTVATNKFIKKFGEMDGAYDLTLKITTAIGALGDGFIVLVDVVGFSVNVIGKLLNTIPATVGTALIAVSEIFIGTFKTIGKNSFILVDNIGAAFENGLPNAVKIGANGALKIMEGFINKVGKAVTGLFSKIPGFEGLQNLGSVSLGRFDTIKGAGAKEFESGFDFTNSINSAQRAKGVYDEFTSSLTAFRKEKTKVDAELRGAGDISGIPSSSGTSGGGGKSSKVTSEELAQKALEELAKKEQEREKRNLDYKEGILEKRKDQIEDLKDAQASYTDAFEDSMKTSQKNIDDFTKKIESLKSEILSLNDELDNLEGDKATTLGDRAIEVEQELKDLQEERKTSTLEEMRVIDRKITALQQEQQLINENTTQTEREESKRVSEQSFTEKYLEEYKLKEKALQDDLALERIRLAQVYDQKAEEEEIYKNTVDAKQKIEEYFAERIKEIEMSITDTVTIESEKRIQALKKVEQQALATARALRSAGVSTPSSSNTGNSTTTNNNTVSPQITVNAQVSSNTDINALGNQLADIVTLSSKGIK